ncbi:hypothetical protein [Streptomyces sp. NPDC004726]
MAAAAHLLLSALSEQVPGAGPTSGTLAAERPPLRLAPLIGEPPLADSVPLTSEPPLPGPAPLTSEPPLAGQPPLTSEPTGSGPAGGVQCPGV